ncbi:hypothetical protein [Arenibaculum pallidiluteum]|uniref:hypothetical protein n=1 Tax=Arenibaculum pallidiluteum TaxID=2812559 RepID=UPI001A95B485|nr:hypothetical protein [Arenibaculum pallidiluteum]
MSGVAPTTAPAPGGAAGAGTGSVAGAPVAGAVQTAGEAVLETLPAKLQVLERAVTIGAAVLGPAEDGTTRLRTPLGEVAIRTPTALPPDRHLMLQIGPGEPPTRAVLLLVAPPAAGQGQAAQPGSAQPPVTGVPASVPSGPASPSWSAPMPPGALPDDIAAEIAAAARPAAPGTTLPGTVLTVPAPPAAPRPPPSQPALAPPIATPAAAAAAYGIPTLPVQAWPAPPSQDAAAAVMSAAPNAPLTAAPVAAALPAAPQEAPQGLPPGTPSPATPQGPPQAAAQPAVRPMPQADLQAGAAPLPAWLRAGVPVDIQVLSLPAAPGIPDGHGLPAPPVGTALSGTVASSVPGGQTVVLTAQGPVAVQTRTTLPPGTTVALAAATAAPAPAAFDPMRGPDWPNLRRAFETIAQNDPATARAVALQVLPQVAPRLAATLSHSIRAVRDGDARRWLGERGAAALLAAGGEKEISGLEEDFGRLARQAAEPLPGDWRALSLPFSDGAEIGRIQLFLRKPVDEDAEADEQRSGQGGAHRFLVEVDLSRLGPLQLDGLIREKRFDLILRSRQPLQAEIRHDILRIFTETVTAMGMSGSVSFQPGERSWVTVQPAPHPIRGLLA